MELFLRVIPFVFLVPGFLTVFLARRVVRKYGLDKKMKVAYENEMSEEEIAQYKFDKALVNIKMIGMLIALPGMVILILVFK